jgi:hypothetical protein
VLSVHLALRGGGVDCSKLVGDFLVLSIFKFLRALP